MLAQLPRTRWGGVVDHRFRPARFFRLVKRDGVLWLLDPDGGRFLSKGVNTVRFDQDEIQNSDRIPYAEAAQRKYGNQAAWRNAAAARLATWGFNTLGGWSDEQIATAGSAPLAVTSILDLGMSFAWRTNEQANIGHKQDFPDVFDSRFDSHVRHKAGELCGDRRDDQHIIGWFIDNELRWGPDWRGPDELLTLFLNLSTTSAGRLATIAWLRERHPDFARFNSIWQTPASSWEAFAALSRVAPPYKRDPSYQRSAHDEAEANHAGGSRATFAADCDAFAGLVAERYFALSVAAIKAADPNHLVLGCRFAYVPAHGVIEAATRHADIISFNCYERDASNAIRAYAATGKPLLIGEFSFRATDSGLPNTNGAGPVVATQAERAACFQHYVASALQNPTIVGYHWFEHADQPAEGRFDGENSNFGAVTIDDRVYEDLTRAMTAVNAGAEELHAPNAGAVA